MMECCGRTEWALDMDSCQNMALGEHGRLEVYYTGSVFQALHVAPNKDETALGSTKTRERAMHAAVAFAARMGWLVSEKNEHGALWYHVMAETTADEEENEPRQTPDLIYVVRKVWEAGYIQAGQSVFFTTIRDTIELAGLRVTNVAIRSALERAGCRVRSATVNESELAKLFEWEIE